MRFWTILAIGVVTVGCSPASDSRATDVADAEAAIRSFWEAVDQYDFTALEAALTDDFEVLKASGKSDRAEFLASLRGAQEAGSQSGRRVAGRPRILGSDPMTLTDR